MPDNQQKQLFTELTPEEGAAVSGGADEFGIVVKGTLGKGVECQTLHTDSNELYTLVGDLKGFQVGDRVYVAGTIAEVSFCMQGQTIGVSWIGKYRPKG